MSAEDEEASVKSPVEEVMSGEDALVATTDLLYQKMQEDPNLEQFFEELDLAQLASKLHLLLGRAFNGEDWPEVLVTQSLIDDSYDSFSSVLRDMAQKADAGGGDNAMLKGLDAMALEVEDERLQVFFEHMQGAVVVAEDEEAGEEGEEEGGAAGEASEEAGGAAKTGVGTDINVNTFDLLQLEVADCQAANTAWNLFIQTADSREAAGEAIYAALFESAPSLQSLFVTPRAVQAMRFMAGLSSFVQALDNPEGLKILVETLGFGHLHLDVTPTRVVIFRDAIVDLLMVELADRFTSQAREAWRRLLNYVGGAIIYIKANYATRIATLLKSWSAANHGEEDDKETKGIGDASSSEDHGKTEASQKSSKKWNFGLSKGSQGEGKGETGVAAVGNSKEANALSAQNVPTTYPEMFLFNAAVMGFGRSEWMNEVLGSFHNIVTNVQNSARLQEECDVLALKIAKVTDGAVNLGEYKSCMLASLRSLLPKDWDSAHEVAWTWLWDNVERLVMKVHGSPPQWERGLSTFLAAQDEDMKFEIRKDIYTKFFTSTPAGQDFFKQSNTYLHIVADKIIAMTLEIYQAPVKVVDDVSALGLRHVGYAIPVELFGPFVSAAVEVIMTRTDDGTTVESFRWSLGLISKMLSRTITEGSTIVMKAINANSAKMLKKAIGCAPRGERADWMLIVQVGSQSISPLAWSVESGNFEAASAIMQDLLRFRADRDRYYYGCDDLFKRHPDMIKMLCDQSPDLVPLLLDGLIWRSRVTENAARRVNYYVKHLLVDEEGSFSPTLGWICNTKDPKLVCHPVIVLLADIVWSRVAYKSFLYGKSWFLFTVLIFITSQSILEHVEMEDAAVQRILVFAGRCFIYFLSMTQLLYSHLRDCTAAYRSKDPQDTFRLGCFRLPRYLKQWQDAASFLLTMSLVGMLCLEPILWCRNYQHGKLFNENCPERADLRHAYTIVAMFAMFFYYVLLIDLSVVSTRISAFSLVCVRMLGEGALFLGALAGAVLTFSSAVSVLKQQNPDFAGIHKGSFALFRMVLRAYDASRYALFRDEPALEIMIIVFLIMTVIFFLSMLIAQLSCAYSAVYEDMVGYARLERAETIVEIVESIPKRRWYNFIESLKLNRRLEFNPGDVGVAGGIQMKEAANIHPTTVDMIRRFGGSTSPSVPWPEDDQSMDGEGEDRFEKMEKLINKTLQRITKSASHRKGGAGTGTGTGTGSGTGTGTQQSGDTGSGSDEHED